MKIVSLKGCPLKERTDFIKEIGLTKEHEDYRHIMGWDCQVVERICLSLRSLQLEKYEYEFYGVYENKHLTE